MEIEESAGLPRCKSQLRIDQNLSAAFFNYQGILGLQEMRENSKAWCSGRGWRIGGVGVLVQQ